MSIQIVSLEPKIISSTITEEELNEIKSQEFLEYLNFIDKILNNKDIYDYIYISIGCKKNENYINDTTPSNSIYQMFPEFLMSFKNPLVLLIDNFNFKYDDMNNMGIIKNWANSKEFNKNIYIIDYLFELTSLIELIKKVFINLEDYNPQKWMICSYIRFKNEHTLNREMIFYNNYIDNLKKLYYDEKYNKYFTNLYMWNGYERFFTDLITQFEYIYIDQKSKNIISIKLNIKYDISKYDISINNIIEFLYQYNKKYKFKYNLDNKLPIDDFFEHSIDIKNFYNFEEQNQNDLFSIYESLKVLNEYY
jgi:hypothetical protein